MTKAQLRQVRELSRLLDEMQKSGALVFLATQCDTGGSISDVREAAAILSETVK